MADLDLRVDYKDDILDSSVNTKRKYNIIENEDGTKSLEDVSVYTQNGDSFGAADINKTNQAVLDLNSSLTFKYNAETDYFQALIDGMWTNWKKAGFKEPISLIPIMTSNTSSECTLSASTEYSGGSGYQAYRAFDGITGSIWQTANGSVPGWLQVKFNEEKVVKKFSINLGGTRSCTIILQASKDGSTWIDLATVTPNPEVTQEISNDNSYMYYRFYSASGYKEDGYSVFGMVEAQLYGY